MRVLDGFENGLGWGTNDFVKIGFNKTYIVLFFEIILILKGINVKDLESQLLLLVKIVGNHKGFHEFRENRLRNHLSFTEFYPYSSIKSNEKLENQMKNQMKLKNN